jgi:thiol-disulfide isomerase/thioredoxin
MKKYLIKSLIILLIFVFTAFFTLLLFAISQGAFTKSIGLEKGISMIVTFATLFILSWLGLLGFKKKVGAAGVLTTMAIVLLVLTFLNLQGATIKFTYKISPYYISWILGVIAGYYFFSRNKKRLLIPIVLAIFPIIMAFGAHDLWIHRIEYGNWSGKVEERKAANFELINKAGEVVNNESLRGKVVIFDFWFINCGPCWVKFPDLQRLHEQYDSNPLVEIYAVNRPMTRDKPGELFEKIEDKGYTFPVLQGTQEVMDALDIYKYPTVMILDQKGNLVFVGELEGAEKIIETMLESIQQ